MGRYAGRFGRRPEDADALDLQAVDLGEDRAAARAGRVD
jgi:hypothetical protein